MSSPPVPTSQPPFLPYMNFSQGIRINYPPGWTHREQVAPVGFAVIFNSPAEDLADQFSENLSIFIEPLPPGVTAEQYTQACLQGMAQLPIQYLENTRSTLAGRPAYRLVYTGPLQFPGVTLSGKYMQYLTVAGSKGCVVTYTAELKKFDKFLPLIVEMCNSLEIN
jgi:eukaryotic-like serine/threonine-protein kinase